EVGDFVPEEMHERKNSDGMTPHELFTKNHEKLKEEAEVSMKGTATSCTVVGALIVTIMFAAAFTIPGGNNGNTGYPMFLAKKLFLVFIISDTLSLVSSTTSVILFLGILTSRYAENDFLKNLPTKMMIGLFTLFLSIGTMMIAFSSALIIMLNEEYSWAIVPCIFVASIPVASFIWLQFPLLIEILWSTYGPGIFDKKAKPWIKL
ncbi:ankyrin repeat-containing protein NPR4-like, partial [Rosa sericea]